VVVDLSAHLLVWPSATAMEDIQVTSDWFLKFHSLQICPYFPDLLWLRLVYLIVNKILLSVIADYGTY